MTFMLASTTLLLSMNFIMTKHPLAMGLILLMQTIVISLICGMFTYSYWLGYILFLIMLGGMLVLFIYMTSLASNELFSMSVKNLLMSLIIMMTMIMLFMMMDNMLMFTNSMEMTPFNNSNNLYSENETMLIKLYNNPTMNITMMMINYLLLTLIVIVKITNINYGSLRQTQN
uniref:NADH-ubiquinone oxidoreductase chain 6 n=1 Tax=Suhpalacsa longialata TaxID=2485742 RepID=A0A3G3C7C9_9NEOP|nr:NADH dehydrogenase subunit 6 [Suhpalacsa longialata]AYP72734.1 NADH dehydrogenase subunit 6 [Suhpalacsa longialata]